MYTNSFIFNYTSNFLQIFLIMMEHETVGSAKSHAKSFRLSSISFILFLGTRELKHRACHETFNESSLSPLLNLLG